LVDAEFEVVVMGNRHNPTKCIVLGKWDEPGENNMPGYSMCIILYSMSAISTVFNVYNIS
jgi:hypothetical protein